MPPVPPTWFNYTAMRSHRELVKPLWLFSSAALRLSFPRRWHCPASHQLNYPWNILPHASSDDALCWERLSGCAFQLHMKIHGGEEEKKKIQWKSYPVWGPFLFFLSLISELKVNYLLAVFGLLSSPCKEQIGVPSGHGYHDNSRDTGGWWKVCFSWYRLALLFYLY